MFALLAWALVWFVAQVAAPAILAGTSVAQLQGGIEQVTTLLVLCSLVAGFAGGLAGGWQSARSAGASKRSVLVSSVAGPLLAAGGFVAFAWIRHDATPLRSTLLNLGLAALGGLIAGALRNRRGSARGRARQAPRPATVVMLVIGVLLIAPAGTGAATYDDIDRGDCTVKAEEHSFSASLTVASVQVGGDFVFRKEKSADGMWHVSVTYGVKGGLELSVGPKLAKATGLALNIATSGHVTLAEINHYQFATEAEADSMIRWAVAPYLSNAVALPGVGVAIAPALASDLSPGSFKAPAPRATQIKLGGAVSLSVAALNLNTEVELGSNVSVELASDHNTDTSVVSDPETITVGLDLEGVGSGSLAGVGADLKGDGEMTLSFTNSGEPGALKVGATTDVTASGELAFGDLIKGVPAVERLGPDLKALDLSVTPKTGLTLAADMTVPKLLEHPRTLGALTDYLVALAPSFDGKPIDDAKLTAASDALAASFAAEADVGLTLVASTAVEGDFEVSYGEGLTFGVKLNGGRGDESLLQAWYRDGYDSIAPSSNCRTTSAA